MTWFELFAWFYSLILRIAHPLAQFAGVFSDRVKRQLEGRDVFSGGAELVKLARKRRLYERAVVFYCSSAGEYEQAKPIMDRLAKEGVFTHVFFFSRSGFDFAIARHEQGSFSLAPLDTIWNWSNLFSAINPELVLIVRHELWPAFLAVVRRWSHLAVLDAVPPSMMGREPAWKTRWAGVIKKWLLGPKISVFTVDDHANRYFRDYVGIEEENIHLIGDTKYDRVRERVAAMREPALLKAQALRKHWNNERLPILVIGSAHLPDVVYVLNALEDKDAPKLRLVVVPHDLSSKNISAMTELLSARGRISESLSDVEVLLIDKKPITCDTIVVETMGRLSELYALGDLAWIGGAVHAKIHNVLEPAAWGIPMTCGVRFKNSQEAQLLVSAELLVPCVDIAMMVSTWQRQLSQAASCRSALLSKMEQLSGASDRLVETLHLTRVAGAKHA